MDIVVCLKRVPFTQEVDLEIAPSKRHIKTEGLAFVLNDWDNYALEEAMLLKERLGGTVTAITIGEEEDEEVLRRALAMGSDNAIRIDPQGLPLDAMVVANLLSCAIKEIPFDLILTGVQADDTNEAMVGVALARRLGIAHASVVNKIETQGDGLKVKIELEGGMEELALIPLPALVTVQTGINQPRYVSVMGIRKAAKKEIKVLKAREMGLSPLQLTPKTSVEEMYLPPELGGAEFLSGDPSTLADKILRILREKGVIS